MADDAPLAPGSTIGILGGGQLGRMLAVAAAELGFRCHIYSPDRQAPALDVAAESTIASYGDEDALDMFAAAVDVATIEFENVPSASLEQLSRRIPVRPGAKSLNIAQDRLSEKQFVEQAGASVAPYLAIGAEADLKRWDFAGGRAVLKTRTLGYDGKGQATVSDIEEAAQAFARFNQVPCILERHVGFRTEISVVAALATDGTFAAFEPAENAHGPDHILAHSTVPAGVTSKTAISAVDTARAIGMALAHVGVFAVEFFVVGDGDGEALLVNEIAPRVHNSGHWTQDGAEVSQFEQHVRAVAGWPLGTARTLTPTRMSNLIGSAAEDWLALAADPDARLHLYGKRETRPGRKMGHVNRIAPRNSEGPARR